MFGSKMISQAVLVVALAGAILYVHCNQGPSHQPSSTPSIIQSLYQPNPLWPPTPSPLASLTTGNLIKQWLNQSLLKSNLLSLVMDNIALHDFSCGHSRCGKQERLLTTLYNYMVDGPKCFCDEECVLLKDCCYDFKQRCDKTAALKTKPGEQFFTCKYRIPPTYFSVVIVESCSPSSSHFNQLCSLRNKTDILTTVPVLDLSSNTTYGNVFCAACNRKKNVSLWRVKASCNKTLNSSEEKPASHSKLMTLIAEHCLVTVYPQRTLVLNHRVCIPRLHTNHYSPVNDSSAAENLKDFCNSYAFPVCGSLVPGGDVQWFKNPHCMLYQGVTDLSDVHTDCLLYDKEPVPLPPLTIFFNFQTTTNYAISSQRSDEKKPKELEQRQVTCPVGQGYDVFSGRCRVFYTRNKLAAIVQNGSIKTDFKTSCNFIKLKKQEYRLFQNGSLLVRGRFLSKENFFQNNGTVFLCSNLTQNFTILASKDSHTSSSYSPLAVLTVAGCALSVFGLVLLIISYAILPELHNLPGKIILSLASTMVVYLVLYFFINRSDLPVMCHVIGKGLHFCLLSMFFWMNVMAFDIHRTFTRKGQNNMHGLQTNGCCSGLYLKYALYCWLVPLLIVIVSFTLEITHAFPTANDSGSYCFISNLYAKLYTLAVPVGLILIYNCIALCHTLVTIRKVQKQVQAVANQSRQPDLPIICLKMTSVMGVTWILGFASSFKALTFLHYLYVILNSFQGCLIFVCYVLNKRVLKMFRTFFAAMTRKRRYVVSKRSKNTSPSA